MNRRTFDDVLRDAREQFLLCVHTAPLPHEKSDEPDPIGETVTVPANAIEVGEMIEFRSYSTGKCEAFRVTRVD